jgi:hypothetical protein
MTRSLVGSSAAVLTLFLVGACSGNGGDVAADPEAGDSSPAPTPPTASPTVGTYPAFGSDDYSYTLVVNCFCPDAGEPIRITVTGGKASTAEWVRPAGHQGRPVPDYWAALTINDVIKAANNTEAAQVTVEWPAGQDHPDSVFVDQSRMTIDEEMGYAVSDVDVP